MPYAAPIRSMIDLDRPIAVSPLISCIMASRGFAFPARHAIECFRRQTYQNRELIIVSAVVDCEVKAMIAGLRDSRIRFLEAPMAGTVGDLRNAGIAQASGELICVWDDDDLSHPERLRWQLAALKQAGGDACFLSRLLLWWPERASLAVSGSWTWENTMLAKKSFLPPYPSVHRGGDTLLVRALRKSSYIVLMEHPLAYCYIRHGSNLWGDDHFGRLFRASLRVADGDNYQREIGLLSRCMPTAAYRDDLALDMLA
jgi:glycosyltransferase involved in cell wall biosynthesis